MNNLFEYYEKVRDTRTGVNGLIDQNTESIIALFEKHWDDIIYDMDERKNLHQQFITLIARNFSSYDYKKINRYLVTRGIFPKIYKYNFIWSIIFSIVCVIINMLCFYNDVVVIEYVLCNGIIISALVLFYWILMEE